MNNYTIQRLGQVEIWIRIWKLKKQIQEHFVFVFVYNLITGCSKKNGENYPKNAD